MVAPACEPRGRSSAQRAEGSPHLGREELRLLPGGEVATPLDLVEVREPRIYRFDPAPRSSPDLAGKRREADGNGDRRRRRTRCTCCRKNLAKLPVPPRGRCAGARQPVQRDVVDDVLASEIA